MPPAWGYAAAMTAIAAIAVLVGALSSARADQPDRLLLARAACWEEAHALDLAYAVQRASPAEVAMPSRPSCRILLPPYFVRPKLALPALGSYADALGATFYIIAQPAETRPALAPPGTALYILIWDITEPGSAI